MNSELILTITYLRLTVGFLGEREQFGWWQSSFFTQGNEAFLSPLFNRTQVLAKGIGVSQAAALIHDERIGVGHVYHLFRLPEELEQVIHQTLQEASTSKFVEVTLTQSSKALEHLRNISRLEMKEEVGPYKVGKISEIREEKPWRVVAGAYLCGFQNNVFTFPYFVG